MKRGIKTKRVKAVICIALIIIMTTGCWNRRELNTLGILDSISYDKNGDRFLVTGEIIDPSAMGEESDKKAKKTKIVITEGYTSAEALRNMTQSFNKKIFVSFVNARFISENLASESLEPLLEYSLRDHEIRETSFMVILNKNNFDKLYTCDTQLSNSMGDYISNIKNAQMDTSSKSAFVETLDFINAYYEEGKEPVAGYARVIVKPENIADLMKSQSLGGQSSAGQSSGGQSSGGQASGWQSSGGQASGGQSSGGQTSGSTKQKYILWYEGLAAFKGTKLVGIFNGIEARAYNIIVNKLKSMFIAVEPELNSTLQLKGCKTDVKTELKNNKAIVHIKTEIRGTITQETDKLKLEKYDAIKKIEEKVNLQLEKEMAAAVQKAQTQFKSDIFGFGSKLHVQHPDEWKKIKDNWDFYFENAEVDIKVQSNIASTGIITNPLDVKD